MQQLTPPPTILYMLNYTIITPIAIYYTNNEVHNHTVAPEDTSV